MSEEEVECPFCDAKTHKIPMEVWKAIQEVYRKAAEKVPERRKVSKL